MMREEKYQDQHSHSRFGRDNKPSFKEALNQGNPDLVREWLNTGVSPVEALSSGGYPPIFLAAINGSVEVMQLLLERDTSGRLLNTRHNQRTPLLEAAVHGRTRAVQWLRHQGLSLTAVDREGNTALLLAVKNGHSDLVRWLWGTGEFLLNTRNTAGRTAFDLATSQETRDFLNQLRPNPLPGFARKKQIGIFFIGALLATAAVGLFNVLPAFLSTRRSDSPNPDPLFPPDPYELEPLGLELSKPDLPKLPMHVRDEDFSRQKRAWEIALDDIHEFAKEYKKLPKKIFISYAPSSTEQDKFGQWLRQLNKNLDRVGMEVYYDTRGIQTPQDKKKQKALNGSDFVIPILTSDFLQGILNSKSLGYEFRLILKKSETDQSAILPIMYSDSLKGIIKKTPLAALPKPLVSVSRRETELRLLLVDINTEPLGVIPTIYDISQGDKHYNRILRQWKESYLTRLLKPLSENIERLGLLEQLQKSFEQQQQPKQDQNLAPIQIIRGTPGVGKTELAIQYANRYGSSEGFARLIYADAINLNMEWLHLGELLGLDLKGLERDQQLGDIRNALKERPVWIIILDNMENPEALKELLPVERTSGQQVLITTRSQKWGGLPVLLVEEFTAEESLRYFRQSLELAQCRGAEELSERLDYFPLALSHAVAYMQQTGIHAKRYLERYEEMGVSLFDHDFKGTSTDRSGRQYNMTVLTTWFLSIQALEARNSKASEAVKFCAYLHPDQIDTLFFQQALNVSNLQLDGCTSAIRDFGLLIQEGDDFKMHRLLQEVIRHWEAAKFASPEVLFEKRIRPLAQALYEVYPFEKNRNEDRVTARKLQPHLQMVLDQLERLGLEKSERNSSTDFQGKLLVARGDFFQRVSGEAGEALKRYEKALAIQLKIYSEEAHDVAASYTQIGIAHGILGDEKLALTYYKKALAVYLKIYSEEHQGVVDSYDNIGTAYHTLGNASAALDYHQKVLAIRLKMYPTELRDLAASYNNVGAAYYTLGNTSAALDCYNKTVRIYSIIYGKNHTSLADSYNNIGAAYRTLGDLNAALDYHHKALAIRVHAYSEEHRDVADSYNNIGNVYNRLKDGNSALEYHQKALAIQLKVYSKAHPKVADSHNNLGNAYDTLSNASSALSHYQKALAIRSAIYTEEHPKVAESYGNIGNAYHALGNVRSALYYHQKGLAIFLKTYPEAHRDVASSYENVGIAYSALGDDKSALTYYKKSLVIRLKLYPEKQHPDVVKSYNSMGNVHQALGNFQSALTYYEKTLEIRLKVHPVEHPDVARSYSDIGNAYDALEDAREALFNHKKALNIRLKLYPEGHRDVATSYINIGNVYQFALRDASSALSNYREALEILLKFYPEDPNVAVCYQNMGVVYRTLGNPHSALEYNNKALPIYLKIHSETHINVAMTYENMGLSYDQLGNYKSARECYGKALKIYQTLKQNSLVNRIRTLLVKLDAYPTDSEKKTSSPKGSFWEKTSSQSTPVSKKEPAKGFTPG